MACRLADIIGTNAGILLIWQEGINFIEVLIEFQTVSFERVACEMAAIVSQPQCVTPGLYLSRWQAPTVAHVFIHQPATVASANGRLSSQSPVVVFEVQPCELAMQSLAFYIQSASRNSIYKVTAFAVLKNILNNHPPTPTPATTTPTTPTPLSTTTSNNNHHLKWQICVCPSLWSQNAWKSIGEKVEKDGKHRPTRELSLYPVSLRCVTDNGGWFLWRFYSCTLLQ